MTNLRLALKMDSTPADDRAGGELPLGGKELAEKKTEKDQGEKREMENKAETASALAREAGAEKARQFACARDFSAELLASWVSAASTRPDAPWLAQGFGDEIRTLWKALRKPFSRSTAATTTQTLLRVDAVLWRLAMGEPPEGGFGDKNSESATWGEKDQTLAISALEEPVEAQQAFAIWAGAGLLSAPSRTLLLSEGQPNDAAERERGVCLWTVASKARREPDGSQGQAPEGAENGQNPEASRAATSMRALLLAEEASRRAREGRGWNQEIAQEIQKEWEDLAAEWVRRGVPPSLEAANAWRGFWLGREREEQAAPWSSDATKRFHLSARRQEAFHWLVQRASDSRIGVAQRQAARPALDWALETAIARGEAARAAERERQKEEKASRRSRKRDRPRREEPGANWLARDLSPGASLDKWIDFFRTLARWEKESPEWTASIATKAMQGFDGPTQAWANFLAAALESEATGVAEAIWARKSAVGENCPSLLAERAAWERAVAIPWIESCAGKSEIGGGKNEARIAFGAHWLIEHGCGFSCLGPDWASRLSQGDSGVGLSLWGAKKTTTISAEHGGRLGALCESIELAQEMKMRRRMDDAPESDAARPRAAPRL